MDKWAALVAISYLLGIVLIAFTAEVLAPMIGSPYRSDWAVALFMSLFFFFNLALVPVLGMLRDHLRAQQWR